MNVFELKGVISINNKAAIVALKSLVENAGRTAQHVQDTFKKVGSATVKAGQTAGKAALAVKTAWVATIESTRDYRTEMAKLDTAFTTNGHSAETATKTYKALQAVLGETDQSVEAANHLAVMCKNEEELSKWTDICTGVFAQFGDSLPIEGLTESANETAKVGQVTGSLADALNWAGVSEDDFNLKLRACRTEQERQKLILNTLYPMYKDQAEQYKENADSIMKANNANDTLTRAMSRLGAVGEPILTGMKLWVADMVNAAVPHLETLLGKLTSFDTTMETEVWPWFQKEAKAKLGIDLPTWDDIKTDFTTKWTNLKTSIEEIAIAAMNLTPPDWKTLKDDITANLSSFITPEMEESLKTIGSKIQEVFGTRMETVTNVISDAKTFGQWCVDNKGTVKEFFSTLAMETIDNADGAVTVLQLLADAGKGLAEIGMETVTGALEWTLTHGKEVAIVLEAISVGLAAAAIAAHPYAAAITAAAAALGLMKEYGGEDRYDHFFDGYSDEELAKLQEYVDASKEYAAARKAVDDALDRGEDGIAEDAIAASAYERLNAIKAQIDEGLLSFYNSWNEGQDGYQQGMFFDVAPRLIEGAETEIQNEISSMPFEATVKMRPDYSGLTYTSTGGSLGRARPTALSHAGGLDEVPYDGYFARLHKGETVLNKVQADQWRGGGGFDVDALASRFASSVMAALSGMSITFDKGAVVGQLAPAMDARLGTIGNRKGRGN